MSPAFPSFLFFNVSVLSRKKKEGVLCLFDAPSFCDFHDEEDYEGYDDERY